MYTVLVTGVGAIIGYGIVRTLRASRFAVRIIGMDIYPDAVGQRWCDSFETALRADAPGYSEFMAQLVRKHAVDLVIPGIEQDMHRLTREVSGDVLSEVNCRWVLNRPELVHIAADKWSMHNQLVNLGLPVIPTFIDGSFDELSSRFGQPLLLKPRRSYASKGIQTIDTPADFDYWKSKYGDDFMVQQIVGSDDAEYTVAAFGLGDGAPVQQMVFQRWLAADGSTSKVRVQEIPELERCVTELVRHFRPVGPTNFQFRLHGGEYLLLEINPRVSSSTSLRAAFGYNEAEMCIEYYLEATRPEQRELRTGSAARFIEDRVTYL